MQRLFRFIALTVLSLTTLSLWADTDDAHAVREARTVKYAAKDIVRLTTRPRFTTLVLLPPQERILDFVIGDKDALCRTLPDHPSLRAMSVVLASQRTPVVGASAPGWSDGGALPYLGIETGTSCPNLIEHPPITPPNHRRTDPGAGTPEEG